jgi:hypothetical protein
VIVKPQRRSCDGAELSAAIPDPYWSLKYNPTGDAGLVWSLDVGTEPEVGGEMWRPRAYHENLHFPIRRWMDVAGQFVEWSARYEEESGEPNGGFYVMEHGDIPRANLRFFERDGVTFRFEWTGVCDVFWNDEYGQDVPFSAAGWAEFTSVIVYGSESDTDETFRARLAEYLDLRDFIQGPLCCDGHCYESGVKMAHTVFTPVGARLT